MEVLSMTDEQGGRQYPGVEPAQAFILPSYQWAVTRLEAIDSRIQALVTACITVTLAIPAIRGAVHPAADFHSWWFVSAVIAAALTLVAGMVARSWGALSVLAPDLLYDKWLAYREWEFKKNALYWAGRHFLDNLSVINRKARVVTVMTVLLLTEAACLLVWLTLF
jgi:hypothetical protein